MVAYVRLIVYSITCRYEVSYIDTKHRIFGGDRIVSKTFNSDEKTQHHR